MLAANPLDGDSRRKIGDLLFRLGDRAGAVEVFRTVGDARRALGAPAARAGRLQGARVAGQSTDAIVAAMARVFAHGAPALAKFAARQAPVDLDARDRAAARRRRPPTRRSW